MSTKNEVIVHSGYRGLRYADGPRDEGLAPGRDALPPRRLRSRLPKPMWRRRSRP